MTGFRDVSVGNVDDKVKEALIKWLFSTIRGSGWPRLNVMSIQVLLEWWPSATTDDTE